MLGKLREKQSRLIKCLFNDDTGSTIVMVLIAFMFVAILVSIIMSSVVVNFRMRSIDRQTKDEFYYAEKALNDIYAGLGENCALALGKSYNEVMAGYKEDTVTHTYQDQMMAYSEFCKKFLDALYENKSVTSNKYGLGLYPKNPDDYDKDKLIEKLNSYVVTKRAKVESIGAIKRYDSSRKEIDVRDIKTYPDTKYTIIKDVKIISDVNSADNNGYVSGITTDIVIETPNVDFFTVNEKNLEYAVSANEGIELRGKTTINGSVYGGRTVEAQVNELKGRNSKYMTKRRDYGGIVVDGAEVTINGEYVVSGGDIYVDSYTDDKGLHTGKLTINHNKKNEIWLDNLTIAGKNAEVNIKGDVYAQGDMHVEGNNSKVTVSGNYYGYDDGTYDTSSSRLSDSAVYEDSSKDRYFDNESDKSSSIVVNAKGANVDLSGLETFVMLGKAYINNYARYSDNVHNNFSDADRAPVTTPDGSNKTKIDNSIGQSVALRTSQEIFLVPTEFLAGDSNPTMYDTATFEFNDVTKAGIQSWFAWDYLNKTNPTKTVRVEQKGVYRAYCYLNFANDEGQRKYVEAVVRGSSETGTEGCAPTAAQIRQRLVLVNEAQNSKITLKNATNNPKVYSNVSVVQFDKDTSEKLSVVSNTGGFTRFNSPKYRDNMHIKYQSLCTYLDPLTNVALSSSSAKSVSKDDYDYKELPFGKLFWEAGIRNNTGPHSEIYSGDMAKYIAAIEADSSKPNMSAEEKALYDNRIECGSEVLIGRSGGGKEIFYDGANDDIAVNLSTILAGKGDNVFVIIDGNAYVNSDVTINGFLYVCGKLVVTENGSLTVNYNSTLLDRRIEAELVQLKKDYINAKKSASIGTDYAKLLRDQYRKDTLIYYIINIPTPVNSKPIKDSSNSKVLVDQIADSRSTDDESISSAKHNPRKQIDTFRKYRINDEGKEVTFDVNADYTEFMYFENWKKGQ